MNKYIVFVDKCNARLFEKYLKQRNVVHSTSPWQDFGESCSYFITVDAESALALKLSFPIRHIMSMRKAAETI